MHSVRQRDAHELGAERVRERRARPPPRCEHVRVHAAHVVLLHHRIDRCSLMLSRGSLLVHASDTRRKERSDSERKIDTIELQHTRGIAIRRRFRAAAGGDAEADGESLANATSGTSGCR